MPICPYECTACGSYQELLVDSPAPDYLLGGECECGNGQACTMIRVNIPHNGGIKDIFVGEWDE